MQHGVNPSCDAVSTWEDTGIQGEHLKLEETSTSVVTFRTPSSPEVRARYRQIAQDGEGDVPHPRFGDGWRLRVDILSEDGSIVDGSVFFRLFRGPEQIVRPYLLGLMTWDEDMRLGALITASLLGSLGYAQGKINPTEKPKEIKKSGILPQLITLISNTPHGPRPSEAPHMMELIHEIAAVLMQEVKRRVGEIAPPTTYGEILSVKELIVKLTYSLPLAALSGLMTLSQPASAQNMISSGTSQFAPKTTPHAVPTLFSEHPASLEQLLNSGYEIRSSASSETGSSMILFRPAQPDQKASWVRCELIGDRNGNVVLRSSHNVTSDCRNLN